MSLKRYVNSAWQDVSTLKKYANGAWTDCEFARKYEKSAWTDVWSGKTLEASCGIGTSGTNGTLTVDGDSFTYECLLTSGTSITMTIDISSLNTQSVELSGTMEYINVGSGMNLQVLIQAEKTNTATGDSGGTIGGFQGTGSTSIQTYDLSKLKFTSSGYDVITQIKIVLTRKGYAKFKNFKVNGYKVVPVAVKK